MTVIAARRQIGGSGPKVHSSRIGSNCVPIFSIRRVMSVGGVQFRARMCRQPTTAGASPTGRLAVLRHEAPRTRSPCSRDLVKCCKPLAAVCGSTRREETSRCLGRSLSLLLAPCWDHPWHRSAPRPPAVAGSDSTPPLTAAGPTGPSSWCPLRPSSSRRPSLSRLSSAGWGSAGTRGSGAASSFDRGLSP
jgi:hypothetical protein